MYPTSGRLAAAAGAQLGEELQDVAATTSLDLLAASVTNVVRLVGLDEKAEAQSAETNRLGAQLNLKCHSHWLPCCSVPQLNDPHVVGTISRVLVADPAFREVRGSRFWRCGCGVGV